MWTKVKRSYPSYHFNIWEKTIRDRVKKKYLEYHSQKFYTEKLMRKLIKIPKEIVNIYYTLDDKKIGFYFILLCETWCHYFII